MAEMLDVYDANLRFVGTADRTVVHTFGLWHKTIHCWLVWNGKMVFQRRAAHNDGNDGKLYTTASGHISAGETIEESFGREIKQEIGILINGAKKLYEGIWMGDFKKPDGSTFVDRVFPNVFYAEYEGEITDLKFDDGEVAGVVAINLEDFIEFAKYPGDEIYGLEFDGESVKEVKIKHSDFTLIADETVYDKFGTIAEKIKMDMDK